MLLSVHSYDSHSLSSVSHILCNVLISYVDRCDYEEAAKRLVVLNDKIEANREQYIHATNNRIKYSDMPTPIIPRRKGKKEAPQAPVEKVRLSCVRPLLCVF